MKVNSIIKVAITGSALRARVYHVNSHFPYVGIPEGGNLIEINEVSQASVCVLSPTGVFTVVNVFLF